MTEPIELIEFENADDPGESIAFDPQDVSSLESVHEQDNGPETTIVSLKNGIGHHLRAEYRMVLNEVQGIRTI